MKVLVAGATGVAGRRSVRQLVAAGHEVHAVARSAAKAALLRDAGAAPVEIDLFDRTQVQPVVAGCEAVVNLATKIPPLSSAMLPGAWRENDRIRRDVARNLVEAALAADVHVYVQESLAFMYRDGGDEWIDEDAAVHPPPHAHTMLDAEAQARRMTDEGRRGVVLRFGQFYSADSTHTRSMVTAARRGVSPFFGPSDSYLALIHADDVATAVARAVDAPAGTYNVVDDEPPTRAELTEGLAAAVGRSHLRAPPTGLLRLGGQKVTMLMRSQRVSNRRFRHATDWSPRFPSAREGFPIVAREVLSAS